MNGNINCKLVEKILRFIIFKNLQIFCVYDLKEYCCGMSRENSKMAQTVDKQMYI